MNKKKVKISKETLKSLNQVWSYKNKTAKIIHVDTGLIEVVK